MQSTSALPGLQRGTRPGNSYLGHCTFLTIPKRTSNSRVEEKISLSKFWAARIARNWVRHLVGQTSFEIQEEFLGGPKQRDVNNRKLTNLQRAKGNWHNDILCKRSSACQYALCAQTTSILSIGSYLPVWTVTCAHIYLGDSASISDGAGVWINAFFGRLVNQACLCPRENRRALTKKMRSQIQSYLSC